MSRSVSNTFFIRTFGCQMNTHDSDRMAQLLVAAGFRPVGSPEEAEVVIVNTCSVRSKAEHKAKSEIGRFKHLRRRKGTLLILAGCVAQQEGLRLLHKAPYIGAVVGPDAIVSLPRIVDELRQGRGPVLAIEEHDLHDGRFVPLQQQPGAGISVPVTIMKGCDNFCSYCVVPYVRGREVSRPLEDILAEVEELSRRGCKEVLLLGQNVNSYRDPTVRGGFPELLEALDRQGLVDRIRFMSSHPKDVSDALVQSLSSLSRVCEHVHLGLQSGSDRILKLMNRGYSADEFVDKVGAFRQRVPGVSVTTDIIVGFPTETEEDFQRTLAVVEVVGFELAYSFKYSARPLTEAARLPDDVPAEVKIERLERLQSKLNEIEARALSLLTGQTREILVEGQSLRNPDQASFQGRTRCNQVVNCTARRRLVPGERVLVRLREARGHTCWGEVVEEASGP